MAVIAKQGSYRQPFIIGVCGGTASGKVHVGLFLVTMRFTKLPQNKALIYQTCTET
jgi:pantothenate kinase-related protein Tda10